MKKKKKTRRTFGLYALISWFNKKKEPKTTSATKVQAKTRQKDKTTTSSKTTAIDINVRPDKELAHGAESLERITNNLEIWIEKQNNKFKNTPAFRKKWISDWFSDKAIMKLFEDSAHNNRFDDIIDTFTLFMPDTAESLKKIWNSFLYSVKFMKHIEKDKDKIEDRHDLGFWCVNFLDTTASQAVERLRHITKLTREYLAVQNQPRTVEKRPAGLLNKQVGKILKSFPSDISASEVAIILNKEFVEQYQPTTPTAIGKTENWKKHRAKNKPHKKKMLCK